MSQYTVEHYLTPDGKDPFQDFVDGLRDPIAKANIAVRITRLKVGAFGDHHHLSGQSIWELRIDKGPGYRVYYAFSGKQIVLLLLGGDKRTQKADIAKAASYWQEWQSQK